jgi:hypothetical protein
MSSQIFKKPVPNEILFDLLQKISANKDNNIDNYYLLNKTCFKQMVYHNYLEDFRDTIKEYYHKSKLHYIERKLDYNKFITIIRQVCSYNKVSYTSKIVYNNSTYDIVYYIYK